MFITRSLPHAPAPGSEPASRATPGLTGLIVDHPAPRLRSIVGGVAEPDIPLLNRPLALFQLAFLRRHGAARVLDTCHASARLESVSAAPDGENTAAPILVVDAKTLTDADVSGMLRIHAELAPAATVMLGVPGRSTRRVRDGGVYLVDRRYLASVLARLSTGRPHGVGAALRATGLPCASWYSSAYTRRLDTPAAYRAAHMDLLDGRAAMLVAPPGRAADGCWIGDGVSLVPDATIVPPSVIGAGTELRAGTRVGPRAVIGAHGRLEPGARVAESVLGDGVVVGASATLDGCVVGSGARIAPFSILAPGAVLGRGAVLRSRTVLPR